MLNLFYKKNDIRYDNLIYGQLEYLTYNVNSILFVLNSYYSSSSNYVRRPNMLASLIGDLDIDLKSPIEDVISTVSSDSIYLASNHNIINGVRTEQEFNTDTVLYNTRELFVYVDDNFDFTSDKCLELESVKCIRSNVSDIILTHPKRYNDSVPDNDFYIYTININLIAVQYYYWAKEQMENNNDIDEARFVYEVLLVNVIRSIFNTNIINRAYDIQNGVFVKPFFNYNPFGIKNVGKKIDTMYAWYFKLLSKKHDMYYIEILNLLPTPTGDTFYDVLSMDVLYLSRRTKWVYILSRINTINFIFKNFYSKKEKAYHSSVSRDFSYMTRNRYLITDNDIINRLIEKEEFELKQNLFLRS